MLKFIVLFFAAFAVFSPLFSSASAKYTDAGPKRALGANIALLRLSSCWPAGGHRRQRSIAACALRPPRRLAVSPRASST